MQVREFRAAIRGKQPRSAASHAISQLVVLESRSSAGITLATGLIGESAEGILRVCELLCPAILILQFVEKPLRDTVLLFRRECRDLGYGRVQGSSHDTNYTPLREAVYDCGLSGHFKRPTMVTANPANGMARDRVA